MISTLLLVLIFVLIIGVAFSYVPNSVTANPRYAPVQNILWFILIILAVVWLLQHVTI